MICCKPNKQTTAKKIPPWATTTIFYYLNGYGFRVRQFHYLASWTFWCLFGVEALNRVCEGWIGYKRSAFLVPDELTKQSLFSSIKVGTNGFDTGDWKPMKTRLLVKDVKGRVKVIFQSFYMKGNNLSKPFSNMAATGCLVGRLALVTGKPLFCDLHLPL